MGIPFICSSYTGMIVRICNPCSYNVSVKNFACTDYYSVKVKRYVIVSFLR